VRKAHAARGAEVPVALWEVNGAQGHPGGGVKEVHTVQPEGNRVCTATATATATAISPELHAHNDVGG
jgi:hypothetical protein